MHTKYIKYIYLLRTGKIKIILLLILIVIALFATGFVSINDFGALFGVVDNLFRAVAPIATDVSGEYSNSSKDIIIDIKQTIKNLD